MQISMPACILTLARRSTDPMSCSVNVASNAQMPPYGPDLPAPPLISDPVELRQLILSKSAWPCDPAFVPTERDGSPWRARALGVHIVINGEKAAYMVPAFQSRRERTIKSLLQHIYDKYSVEAEKTNRNAVRPGQTVGYGDL